MKRIIVIVMVLAMVFMSVNSCYAAAEPRYISIVYYNNEFTIDEGIANYKLTVTPDTLNVPDKVTAAVKIVHVDSGTTVYSKTKTMSYSSVSRCFTASDTKTLTNRGEYEMRVTYKCYSGSTLLETITAATVTSSY